MSNFSHRVNEELNTCTTAQQDQHDAARAAFGGFGFADEDPCGWMNEDERAAHECAMAEQEAEREPQTHTAAGTIDPDYAVAALWERFSEPTSAPVALRPGPTVAVRLLSVDALVWLMGRHDIDSSVFAQCGAEIERRGEARLAAECDQRPAA